MNILNKFIASFFIVLSGLFVFHSNAEEGLDPSQIFKKETFPTLIKESKILLNVRPRYEYANQGGRDDSNAVTLRTRLGFKTGTIYGISALVEMEDVRVIGSEGNFNPYPRPGRTVIADPEGTELNRAQLNLSGFKTEAIIGRQRIKLDKDRFIGNVGWRQNEQTYDAVTFKNQNLSDLTLYYGFINKVHRIFGHDAPLDSHREFSSSSHLVNVAYAGLRDARVTLYAYLLDLENAPANSGNTIGASLDRTIKIQENTKITLHGEFAHQRDGGENPADYEANYYSFNATCLYQKFSIGGGYELLGSDNDQGFRTPLATLHAYNGWADVFLNTPPQGLEDIYFAAGISLAKNISVKAVYHWFNSDQGDTDYGNEIDAVISKKIDKHWSVLAKYAFFYSDGIFADQEKFWLQSVYSF